MEAKQGDPTTGIACLIVLAGVFVLICWLTCKPVKHDSSQTAANEVSQPDVSGSMSDHPPVSSPSSPPPSSANLDGKDSTSAYIAAKHFVSLRLKAPSTAKFAPEDEIASRLVAPNKWAVASYVDAQNSFGAMLRTHFVCTVRYDGNDHWTVGSMTFAKQ